MSDLYFAHNTSVGFIFRHRKPDSWSIQLSIPRHFLSECHHALLRRARNCTWSRNSKNLFQIFFGYNELGWFLFLWMIFLSLFRLTRIQTKGCRFETVWRNEVDGRKVSDHIWRLSVFGHTFAQRQHRLQPKYFFPRLFDFLLESHGAFDFRGRSHVFTFTLGKWCPDCYLAEAQRWLISHFLIYQAVLTIITQAIKKELTRIPSMFTPIRKSLKFVPSLHSRFTTSLEDFAKYVGVSISNFVFFDCLKFVWCTIFSFRDAIFVFAFMFFQ